MTHPRIRASVAGLLTFVLIGSTAFAAEDSKKDAKKDGSLVISSDVVVGSDIVDPGADRAIDQVEDLIVDANTGQILMAITGHGVVLSCHELRWNEEKRRFDLRTDAKGNDSTAGESKTKYRHRNRSDKDDETQARTLPSKVLLSDIDGLDIWGSTMDEGEKRREKIGDVNGAFIDVRTGHLAFVTTNIGGTLGFGAESKVLPWCLGMVERSDEGELRYSTRLMEDRLKKAPSYGVAGNQLHNPKYRGTLYAFYGVDKPDFEHGDTEGARTEVVTLDFIIGAEVTSSVNGEETDEIEDLLIDRESGQVNMAVLDSGKIVPIDALRWNHDSKKFELTSTEKTAPKSKESYILASRLAGNNVRAKDAEVGEVEDVYFDTQKNQLAFVSLAVDQTLGMGGHVKVLTWKVVDLEPRERDAKVSIRLTKNRVERAPELDGKVGSDLHNPEFRKKVSDFSKDD